MVSFSLALEKEGRKRISEHGWSICWVQHSVKLFTHLFNPHQVSLNGGFLCSFYRSGNRGSEEGKKAVQLCKKVVWAGKMPEKHPSMETYSPRDKREM